MERGKAKNLRFGIRIKGNNVNSWFYNTCTQIDIEIVIDVYVCIYRHAYIS